MINKFVELKQEEIFVVSGGVGGQIFSFGGLSSKKITLVKLSTGTLLLTVGVVPFIGFITAGVVVGYLAHDYIANYLHKDDESYKDRASRLSKKCYENCLVDELVGN